MPILVRVVDSVDKAEYNVVCVVFYMIVTYYLFHIPRHMYIHWSHPLTHSIQISNLFILQPFHVGV